MKKENPPNSSPAYTVLARRYRPQRFDEVAGQPAIVRTLQNALSAGRVGHAYLFSGPRGVGKTSVARIFAKALNCERGVSPEPCNQCDVCRRISQGDDADVIEIDAASHTGVDDVRVLRDNTRYMPLRARTKIYIIDEAHMLSRGAFNALLKTLEEPPAHVKFVFATTEPHKLPETIHSRCQRLEFRRLGRADLVARLGQIGTRERLTLSGRLLEEIARLAGGSMRDAESLLDQIVAFAGPEPSDQAVVEMLGTVSQEVLFELWDRLLRRDSKDVLAFVDRLYEEGKDLAVFLDQCVEYARALLVIRTAGAEAGLVDGTAEEIRRLEKQASAASVDYLLLAVSQLAEARRRLRESSWSRLVLEVSLLKLTFLDALCSVPELIERLGQVSLGGEGALAESPPPAARSAQVRSELAAGGREGHPPPPATLVRAESIPPPPDAPASPGTEPSEEAKIWANLLENVKARNMTLHAFLKEGRIAEIEGESFCVEFPSDFTFHKDQLEQSRNREVVESCLHEVLGHRARLVLRLGSGTPFGKKELADPVTVPRGPEKRRDSLAESLRDPGVKRVLEMFEGKVVERKDESPLS